MVRRFCVSDIMDLPANWAEGADLMYTDPPWEQKLVKMFETIAERDAGRGKAGNDINKILGRMFGLCPRGRPAFIEYGLEGYQRVERIGRMYGFRHAWTRQGTQTNGNPYVVVAFNTDMPAPGAFYGWEMLAKVHTHHKPGVIFEPFAGHGQHARRWASLLGCEVIVSEYNPARAAKLVEWFGL